MQCALYDAGRCRSCQWITQSVNEQLSAKTADLHRLLAGLPVEQWCAPIGGPEQHFRNKAKMVVSGSVEKPLFGMLHRDGTPVDLCGCPLYPASFAPVFSALKPFIARAGLTPYNVARKRGELKYLLLTESQFDGGMMLRFVLRSETKLTQLRAALPWLRPQSFFQTNPTVASRLYATARDWVGQLPVRHMWDLFCGVGGFGLHCATPQMQLTGIEIAPEAIACAKQSAAELGLTRLHFQALDSTQFATAQGETPDLVLVNPPRRGIGKPLCDYLAQMAPRFIIYSSCNAQTMAQDIRHLPNYRIQRVQLFDMFPHTAHYEVLALLRRSI
ncbi:methyltransferase domain-containing protein [Salmonella enterica]|uniref:methyltransferase domain-containing protein n=1 Tax=Salmonella enterica TaxID=28901 RepID=UPI0039775E1B